MVNMKCLILNDRLIDETLIKILRYLPTGIPNLMFEIFHVEYLLNASNTKE